MRPVVVFGLLHAGLAIVREPRTPGHPGARRGASANEFGLRSRYLASTRVVDGEDGLLEALRAAAAGGERPVLFPERDENVEAVLNRWAEVRQLADVPLPDDPEATMRLRRKDVLPQVAAEAGVDSPKTIPAESPEQIRAAGLRPPLLLKAVEGQEFAHTFGEKAFVAPDLDAAVAGWKRAREHGFHTIVQELVPDSHEHVWSLFTYIARDGEPRASVVGARCGKGRSASGRAPSSPPRWTRRFTNSASACSAQPDTPGSRTSSSCATHATGSSSWLEVNTRPPIWAGIAMGPELGIAGIAYEDLCGTDPQPERTLGDGSPGSTWRRTCGSPRRWPAGASCTRASSCAITSAGRRCGPSLRQTTPRPALASLNYLRSRV